ncbi:MAG: hypothetical protein U0441_31120 [Polyangiaceae bacterium]
MPTITVASSDSQLAQILALQRRYSYRSLSAEQQHAEGFVFAEHTLPVLRRMAAELPQAVALADEKVVGYCLSMHRSLKAEVPSLAPMFAQFEQCSFRGKPLSEYHFMVGGQVCVDREFRGLGLLAGLYRELGRALPPHYELCVTEIATRNEVSVRAHQKMGFEPVATYRDDKEEWVIVAWDLARGHN